ncbi:hypothetical protein Zmor_022058 [Zophobas morio]|uniref:Gustatory receptor n=1 Tax=Zophobas morio TaxID=2755281 RepID=A0AA38I7I4_9CUCU|nr:hypothetical protein Zmor_022058 [Zophobas morio]
MIFVAVYLFSVKTIYVDENNTLQTDVSFYELTAVFSQNVIIILLVQQKRKEIAALVSHFMILEKMTSTIKQGELSGYIKAKKRVFVVALLEYGLTTICCIIDCSNNPPEAINTAIYFIAFGCHFNYELLLIASLVFLIAGFQELGYILASGQLDPDEIKKVCEIHTLLKNVFILVKTSFERIILVKTISDTFISTTGIHYQVRMILENRKENKISKLIFIVIWGTLISVYDFGVAYFFGGVLEQDKLVSRQIDEALSRLEKTYKRNTLRRIHKHINQTDVKICGLFPINCTLIFWMGANITTYTTYLVQFSKIGDDLFSGS